MRVVFHVVLLTAVACWCSCAAGSVGEGVAAPQQLAAPSAAAAEARGGRNALDGLARLRGPISSDRARGRQQHHQRQHLAADQAAAAAPSLKQCARPGEIEVPKPGGVPIPPLPEGRRPNIILIVADDVGYDDLGMHNRRYVRTPNLDAMVGRGTSFSNFYTQPECAQTRATVLTGRHFARTGTMLVMGGYDFIHSDEVTAGEFMASAGYATAHFGKWHNGQSLGYEPWHVGFEESWFPASRADDGVFCNNGRYERYLGNMEEALLGRLIAFLDAREAEGAAGRPFFLYWAPHLIHWDSELALDYGPSGVPPFPKRDILNRTRSIPKEFLERYTLSPDYVGVDPLLLQTWAAMEFLDSLVGRLLDRIAAGPLANSTFVAFMGDNGPGSPATAPFRTPSYMQGTKHSVLEGGIRNYLTVQGPGVRAGVVDDTLVEAADLLPTMADLAGVGADAVSHPPWDGISLKHLLVAPANELKLKPRPKPKPRPVSEPSSSLEPSPLLSPMGDGSDREGVDVGGVNGGSDWGVSPLRVQRGASMATPAQTNRHVVGMSSSCWPVDAVPQLGRDREIERPQRLLSYGTGGLLQGQNLGPGPGFARCLSIRYKQYKWVGETNTTYEFDATTGSHLELPCNAAPHAARLSAHFSEVAWAWWQSVVEEPHSFAKPVFYLGLGDWKATNILAAGLHESRPAGTMHIVYNSVRGFGNTGDRACYSVRVLSAGAYDVALYYKSSVEATFKFSLGDYSDIVSGSAPSITAVLPMQNGSVSGFLAGTLQLPASPGLAKQEACLELVGRPRCRRQSCRPVMTPLSNMRLIKQAGDGRQETLALLNGKEPGEPARAVRAPSSPVDPRLGIMVGAARWPALREQNNWPDGQVVFESMFTLDHE